MRENSLTPRQGNSLKLVLEYQNPCEDARRDRSLRRAIIPKLVKADIQPSCEEPLPPLFDVLKALEDARIMFFCVPDRAISAYKHVSWFAGPGWYFKAGPDSTPWGGLRLKSDCMYLAYIFQGLGGHKV